MSAEVDLVAFISKSARVEAIGVGSREMFEAMNKAIAFHSMRPVVDRVFGFSAGLVRKAFMDVTARKQPANCVLG
jgi:hypothetical protein